MQVIKRDGRKQKFDKEKIYNAVSKAFIEIDGELTEQDKKKSYEITMDFIKAGSSIKEVAKERELTLVTVMSHIQQYIAEGNKVDFIIPLDEFFNEEEEKIVLDAIDKVGYSKLKDIKEIVSDKISYDTIRAVVLKKIINELNN